MTLIKSTVANKEDGAVAMQQLHFVIIFYSANIHIPKSGSIIDIEYYRKGRG